MTTDDTTETPRKPRVLHPTPEAIARFRAAKQAVEARADEKPARQTALELSSPERRDRQIKAARRDGYVRPADDATPTFLSQIDPDHLSRTSLASLLYVAYGSNLDVERMRMRCPTAEPAGAATLVNHRLVFRGVADVVPDNASHVPVGLWRVTADDVAALDSYEGWPRLYRRKIVRVRVGKHVSYGFCYVMNGGAINPPSDGYFNTMDRGYTNFGLDRDVLLQAAMDAEDRSRAAALRRAIDEEAANAEEVEPLDDDGEARDNAEE